MREKDIKKLNEPYKTSKNTKFDNRFASVIGADVPNAEKLQLEIFDDLDEKTFGINWWTSLPSQERILISDYLYQSVTGIIANLTEAKLHYLEWLGAREKNNERIADVISRDNLGNLKIKMPPSKKAIDDLHSKLETLHICGFFRAIGSTLDCLGATIIGVLALPTPLRRSDINRAIKSLDKIIDKGDKGSQTQLCFKDFFEDVKTSSGSTDWLEWADQYRNMYVHRGRRNSYHQIVPRDNLFYDSNGQVIPRAKETTHLAKYPDRSEVEALIKGKYIQLNEDAKVTLSELFNSCRNLVETTCEELVQIWQQRRKSPSILEQPVNQWDSKIRSCKFIGYDLSAEQLETDMMIGHPINGKRMKASAVDDANRIIWKGSDWE